MTLVVVGVLNLWGCERNSSMMQMEGPQMAAFVELVLPQKVQVQKFLTRPVSFAGDGNPDGIEVVLAVLDAFDDPVKTAGTFHFELYSRRPSSGDPAGERLAFWEIRVDSRARVLEYWDRLSRFYRFPLRLESAPLPPGSYFLEVRLVLPGGEKRFDEYVFELPPGPVPSAR
jgi:hypothetical protein